MHKTKEVLSNTIELEMSWGYHITILVGDFIEVHVGVELGKNRPNGEGYPRVL